MTLNEKMDGWNEFIVGDFIMYVIIALMFVGVMKLYIVLTDNIKIKFLPKLALMCFLAVLLVLSSVYVINAFGHQPHERWD